MTLFLALLDDAIEGFRASAVIGLGISVVKCVFSVPTAASCDSLLT